MKNHELPEFQVIRQKEANAKFFVASGEEPFTPTPAPGQTGKSMAVFGGPEQTLNL